MPRYAIEEKEMGEDNLGGGSSPERRLLYTKRIEAEARRRRDVETPGPATVGFPLT